ncbi:ABC transporter permease subunit [Ornithinibacillus salinisoli]|uniref:ABC transporter permease subunit n=1 Tax=Ornithinibacillus salinisoli TaxID=1848459 RepID=A0ABW4VV63_9BACI
MVWQVSKNILTFLLVLIGIMLILLLPREREIEVFRPTHQVADYPFTMELYKENISQFIDHFQTNNGFGTTKAGTPIMEEIQRFLVRSLKIIIPGFILTMLIGPLIGVLQFYNRKRKRGRVLSFFSWIFSSIPDFFLFISCHYLLLVLMRHGLPRFNIYSNDDWYSFIIPLVAIMIFPLSHMVKVTSVAMENEMSEEYVRTVLSKGLTRYKALVHMVWNCWSTIINQSQLVIIYILSSLPIIEKLSNYNGAGYQLLQSILEDEDVRALAFMLPLLVIVFTVTILSLAMKYWLVPKGVREA